MTTNNDDGTLYERQLEKERQREAYRQRKAEALRYKEAHSYAWKEERYRRQTKAERLFTNLMNGFRMNFAYCAD